MSSRRGGRGVMPRPLQTFRVDVVRLVEIGSPRMILLHRHQVIQGNDLLGFLHPNAICGNYLSRRYKLIEEVILRGDTSMTGVI